MRKELFLSIIVLALVFSCKKDDEKSKTDLLVGEWKLTSGSVDPTIPIYDDDGYQVGTTSDFTKFYDDCELDDTQEYTKDGDILFHDNEYSCNSPSDYTPLKWTFNGDETAIVMYEGDDSQSEIVNIIELTEKKLTVKGKLTYNGVTYTIIVTYNKV